MFSQNEKELTSKCVFYSKKRKGIMHLTNKKCLWCSVNNPTLPEISLYYSQIQGNQSSFTHGGQNFIELRVIRKQKKILFKLITNIQKDGKDFPQIFSMKGNSNYQKDFDQLSYILDKLIQQQDISDYIKKKKPNTSLSITEEQRQQIDILKKNHFIRQLHQKYVINGNMSENSFWSDLNLNYQQQGVGQNMMIGAPNKLTLLTKKHNIAEDVWEISFDRDIADLIKRLYPQVDQVFKKMIPLQCSEQEFWQEFVKYQDIHSTQIIGGLNPMKIPQKFKQYLHSSQLQDNQDDQYATLNQRQERKSVNDKNYLSADKKIKSKDLGLILMAEQDEEIVSKRRYGAEIGSQMEIESIINLDTRQGTGQSESKIEKLIRRVNMKSEKLIQQIQGKQFDLIEGVNNTQNKILVRQQQQQNVRERIYKDSTQKKIQSLSQQQVMQRFKIWSGFFKNTKQVIEDQKIPRLQQKSKQKNIELIQKFTSYTKQNGSKKALKSMTTGDKKRRKHFKEVQNILKLFYSSFPISKKFNLSSLQKWVNQLKQKQRVFSEESQYLNDTITLNIKNQISKVINIFNNLDQNLKFN